MNKSYLTPTHRATLEEVVSVLESAVKHNDSMGRTIFAHGQRERARLVREILEDCERSAQ